MRLFSSLAEAYSEIGRDLYKGPKLTFTRVQQRTGESLPGRELLGYTYSIEPGGIPTEAGEIEQLSSGAISSLWLESEELDRAAEDLTSNSSKLSPALRSTFEGSWQSYTYPERLFGAGNALSTALHGSPDSRRAFWPIFHPEDSLRAASPTRIPCSLGYQVLIRNTTQGPQLLLFYLQRSCDYDNFFLSDVYLAHAFQRELASRLSVPFGQFMHFIVSLHSFAVEGTEIY